MQTMTATLFSHLNEQGYKFSMITTGISRHVRYLLDEKGAGAKTSIKTSMRWSVFFSTSVANETEHLNIWSKLNQWRKYHNSHNESICSWYLIALKKVRKKFTNHCTRKTTVRMLKKQRL